MSSSVLAHNPYVWTSLPLDVFVADVLANKAQYTTCFVTRIDHYKEKSVSGHEFVVLDVVLSCDAEGSYCMMQLRCERRPEAKIAGQSPGQKVLRYIHHAGDIVSCLRNPDLSSCYHIATMWCPQQPFVSLCDICEIFGKMIKDKPHYNLKSANCYWFCSTFLQRLSDIVTLYELPCQDYQYGGRFIRIKFSRDPSPLTSRVLQCAIRERFDNTVTPVRCEDIRSDDAVVLVLGPSGSGKTSFINMATGYQGFVNNGLDPGTTELQAVRYHVPNRRGLGFVLVDTPTFDLEREVTPAEVYLQLRRWLERIRTPPYGFIWAHPICDNRLSPAELESYRAFKDFCGKQSFKAIIMTTMWDELDDEGQGKERQKRLGQTHWAPMLKARSTVVEYRGTRQSAWGVLDSFTEF